MNKLEKIKSMTCSECKHNYPVTYAKWIKRNCTKNNFCSRECDNKFRGCQDPIKTNCKNCHKEIIKPAHEYNKRSNHFCGRSCSAVFNNANRPKRPVKKLLCPQCNKKCATKTGVCKTCRQQNSYEEYSKLTLGDKTYDKHKYAKYAYVRYYAKRKALELGWTKCVGCGYDKHFEVAHIRPISDFPPETLLIEINHESNLKPLCPNCHWEFDNL